MNTSKPHGKPLGLLIQDGLVLLISIFIAVSFEYALDLASRISLSNF